MTNQPLKVALFGNVEGEIQALVDKITAVNNSKGGPFDHYFVLGNLFKEGDNDECIDKLLSGEYKFPVHTYFLLGDRALPERVLSLLKSDNNLLTENFEFLGNSGKLTLTSGLKIAYFSGSPQENVDESELQPHQYNVADIQKMIDTTENDSIDVLLTYDWPKGVLSQSKSSILPPPQPNNHLNNLIQHIKPKYHFASQLSNNFVELEPYAIQINPTISSLTRFYNIAAATNHNGQKWSYAMKINPDQPNQHLQSSLPLNHIQSPLLGQDAVTKTTKRNFEVLEEEQPQANSHFFANTNDTQQVKKTPKKGYLCKICNIEGHFIGDCPQKTQPKKTLYSTNDCWFCVSNEKCASHLIVSLGEELYLAMARGSLIDPKAPSTKIPGGGQLLIMPIPHTSTVANFETQPESKGYKELASFKKAISEFYATFDCFPFYFETYRPAVNQHGLLQVFPVPNEVKETLDKAIDEAIDEAFAKENTQPELSFQPSLEKPFIRVEYLEIVKGASFQPRIKVPLYLGRQVLGSVLNCEDRIDWKKCEELTIDEETQFNKDFTTSFSKYDPFA